MGQFHHPLQVEGENPLDQRRNFESELIADLYKLTGTMKLGTPPYHPTDKPPVQKIQLYLNQHAGDIAPGAQIQLER